MLYALAELAHRGGADAGVLARFTLGSTMDDADDILIPIAMACAGWMLLRSGRAPAAMAWADDCCGYDRDGGFSRGRSGWSGPRTSQRNLGMDLARGHRRHPADQAGVGYRGLRRHACTFRDELTWKRAAQSFPNAIAVWAKDY